MKKQIKTRLCRNGHWNRDIRGINTDVRCCAAKMPSARAVTIEDKKTAGYRTKRVGETAITVGKSTVIAVSSCFEQDAS